tara:strand:+ start:25 stop:270 length:246 start_codon:yes stop_codon:yes gene_type:complete
MQKNIKIGDLVEFIEYYVASGIQGMNLTKTTPKYNCLGIVLKTKNTSVSSSKPKIKTFCVMMPGRHIEWVGEAMISTIASL